MSFTSIYDPEKYPDEYWEKYRREDGRLCAWDVPNEELKYVVGFMDHEAWTKGGTYSMEIALAITTPKGFVTGCFPEVENIASQKLKALRNDT